MVVGFNHNFRYKGEVYHVQTEDGGLKSPNIVTLLYKDGTILASRKTSYTDILGTEHLAQVVEELMKEQHKEMLRRLKEGEFDALLEGRRPAAAAPSDVHCSAPGMSNVTKEPRPPARPAPESGPLPPSAAPPTASLAHGPEPKQSPAETSLDEIILSYLLGEETND
ncbi:MAG: hypothetical protein P8Z70_02020 [Desulfuromonadales bacterium]|jgi:hypothetical protein